MDLMGIGNGEGSASFVLFFFSFCSFWRDGSADVGDLFYGRTFVVDILISCNIYMDAQMDGHAHAEEQKDGRGIGHGCDFQD